MSDPTSVYLYYDRVGVLLYVGITKRSTTRQHEHGEMAEWWPFVAKQEIEHHPSREVALARETMLIRERRPPFNRQQNPDHAILRAAYFTLFAPGEAPLPAAPDCNVCTLAGDEDPCPWPNVETAPWRGRASPWSDIFGCGNPDCAHAAQRLIAGTVICGPSDPVAEMAAMDQLIDAVGMSAAVSQSAHPQASASPESPY